jgi:hypothetical protein
MNPQNSPMSSGSAGGTDSGGRATESSGTLAEAKSKIAQTARETASKVKSAASNTAARATEEAERVASEKKETAANRIGEYSSAIHDSARSLEEKDPNIAWFTHRAADKLQGVADYMRNRGFPELRHDVEGIARRHPAAFFGGMFVAGLILGNVVKASRRNLDDGSDLGVGGDEESRWSRDSAETSDTTQAELTQAERSAAGI